MQLFRAHLRILHLALDQKRLLRLALRQRLAHLLPQRRARALLVLRLLPNELGARDEGVPPADGDDGRGWGGLGGEIHYFTGVGARGRGDLGEGGRRWGRNGFGYGAIWGERVHLRHHGGMPLVLRVDVLVAGLDGREGGGGWEAELRKDGGELEGGEAACFFISGAVAIAIFQGRWSGFGCAVETVLFFFSLSLAFPFVFPRDRERGAS